MRNVTGNFLVRVVWLKLAEFSACAALATAFLSIYPGDSPGMSGPFAAVQGGVMFAVVFYLLTLYPAISGGVLVLGNRLGISSPVPIAVLSSVFLLAYTAAFALALFVEHTLRFWTAWALMGGVTYLLTLWIVSPALRTTTKVT